MARLSVSPCRGACPALLLEGSRRFGCRYLNLDAQPELVPWYESQGFRINKIKQKERIQVAAGKRDVHDLPVSMRFDLFDVR